MYDLTLTNVSDAPWPKVHRFQKVVVFVQRWILQAALGALVLPFTLEGAFHLVTATIKACSKLLLQTHEKKKKGFEIKSSPQGNPLYSLYSLPYCGKPL